MIGYEGIRSPTQHYTGNVKGSNQEHIKIIQYEFQNTQLYQGDIPPIWAHMDFWFTIFLKSG